MQWFIDIIVAICKAYTDAQIAALKAYTDAAILNGKNMPQFSIVLWHGKVVDIPNGWVICNGANGTPNLLGRFTICPDVGYPRDATGGSATHTHGAGAGVAGGKAITATANNLPPYYSIWYIMKL
ncbi:hypothetical protein ES703_94002 [subsurface metagenome]